MSPAPALRLTKRSSPRVLLLGLAAVALLSAGCGAGGDGSAGNAATQATDSVATTQVEMKVLEFTPGHIEAKVGQTVTWTNADSVAHNVTYEGGPRFTSSPRELNPGAKFSITLTHPGTIHYFCSIHPWMKGTIVVSP
ncbi:MAG: cupredoxin domain-containing protein [Solirubrobacterales bacterium]|nr:cupredoxin domain-containing protein [Solirubrobacterales bacterium]